VEHHLMRAGFHAVAIIAAVIWFGLNGLLWYAKPSDLLWLLGSAILGVLFFVGFYLYLMHADADSTDGRDK
jgi:quinol-cytochrome oxidoreductase complex cytochrome b subunit